MGLYSVKVNIVHGAKDTRRSVDVKVPAKDRLSAAANAERFVDRTVLHESPVEYAHAVCVKPMPLRRDSVFRQFMPDAI
jgi:hypothetical protein